MALLLLLLVTSSSALTQLHFLFRHGERAPTETYQSDPYKNYSWPNGWGHLTNRGKLQMFELGVKLRRLYPDFIPELYFPEDVSILSSYSERCLMSAQLLLAGLFPPKNGQVWNEELNWQPIPVHYKPRSQDNLIAMKAQCPKYDEEFTRIQNTGEIAQLNDKNQELFEFLSEKTGQQVTNIGHVEALYNTLEIELLNDFTLPDWTKNVSFPHLKQLAARYLESFTETTFMKRMKGGVFLKHLLSQNEKPILFLYAAHDVTLVHILKTLGYKKVLKPGFGASLSVEIGSDSVSFLYRDDSESEPENVTPEKCSPCSLSRFKAVLDDVIPNNWEEECIK